MMNDSRSKRRDNLSHNISDQPTMNRISSDNNLPIISFGGKTKYRDIEVENKKKKEDYALLAGRNEPIYTRYEDPQAMDINGLLRRRVRRSCVHWSVQRIATHTQIHTHTHIYALYVYV